MIPCLRLTPAHGLHLGLLPLFGAPIGEEVTLTKPTSGSLQPVRRNQSDHADGRGEIAA
jgi:hypothetical protein